MRVELATKVTIRDVDLGLVNEADDLDVGRRAHELHAGEGTLGNETRAWGEVRIRTCEKRAEALPRPGFVHHATSSPSVSAIMEFGSDGAQRQKSEDKGVRLSGFNGVCTHHRGS